MKFFLKNFEEIVSGLAMSAVLILVIVNVIMRYFFSISFEWMGEIAKMGFAWVVFVGAGACYKRKMHIGIDVVVNLLSQNLKRVFQILLNCILAVVNIYIFYLSIIFAFGAWIRPTPILGLPYTLVDLSLTVGFGSMTIYSIKDLIHSLKNKNNEQIHSEN